MVGSRSLAVRCFWHKKPNAGVLILLCDFQEEHLLFHRRAEDASCGEGPLACVGLYASFIWCVYFGSECYPYVLTLTAQAHGGLLEFAVASYFGRLGGGIFG